MLENLAADNNILRFSKASKNLVGQELPPGVRVTVFVTFFLIKADFSRVITATSTLCCLSGLLDSGQYCMLVVVVETPYSWDAGNLGLQGWVCLRISVCNFV